VNCNDGYEEEWTTSERAKKQVRVLLVWVLRDKNALVCFCFLILRARRSGHIWKHKEAIAVYPAIITNGREKNWN
jgi:hypothetical protein